MTSPDGMVTWGLDLSTDPRKCAAVAIRWDAGRPHVLEVRKRLTPAMIVDLITSRDAQFAVDVPFGWPDAFIGFVTAHRDQAQRPPGDRDAWRKETLARRATDDRLLRYGALPLPAAFDRLGKTAVMWSAIEFDLGEAGIRLDRSGITGRVCETYPSAALAAWRLPKAKPSLEFIRQAFPFLTIGNDCASELSTGEDARDALVCALVARAAALHLTVLPGDGVVVRARREGWIHVMEQDPRALLGDQTAAWLSVPLYVPSSRSLDEDAPKRTFDFWRADGTQVDTLEDYAGTATGDRRGPAAEIVNYAFPQAVPSRLSHEAWALVTQATETDRLEPDLP